jgi:hypothetical protein
MNVSWVDKEQRLLLQYSEASGVYFLRHMNDNIIKIGSTKNITKRLKTHKQDFGSENIYMDMFIKTDTYVLFEDVVKQYTNDVFSDMKGHTHTEIIRYESDETIEKLYERFKEIECSTRHESVYYTELQVDLYKLRVRELELLNTKKKTVKKDIDIKNSYLYKFLVEKSVYDKDNIMNSVEIRKLFQEYMGKDIRKLDYGTFIQVDERYEILYNKKTCKHCMKEAVKGCCIDYNNKDRVFSNVIKHIRILPV